MKIEAETGFQKGVIEGFYGEPWSWPSREAYAPFLRENGYQFYYYAPKGDPLFRKKWRDPFPADHRERLANLVGHYHYHGLKFGIGFSPYEIFRSFDHETKKLLKERIQLFDDLKIDTLAILFDDMKGDLPELALTQIEILHWVREQTRVPELLFCPTYYTFDPVLDRVFGPRPANYLEDLGTKLDQSIGIFWTGEKVCSTEYSDHHVREVGQLLGRKPFLWDNYPVNDGASMCKFLKLRAVTGRPATLRHMMSGHAVNPMNQAELTKIPLLSLKDSYQQGASYDPDQSFIAGCEKVGSTALRRLLERDLSRFQDEGLTRFSSAEKAMWKKEYLSLGTAAGLEVAGWLDGHFEVTRELVQTQ